MYKLKHIPEDFIVEEIIDLKLNKGNYDYYKLTKINWNTFDVIERLAIFLKIPIKNLGFAGNKDRHAITSQYISVYRFDKKKVLKFKLKDVKLEYVGSGNERINLGDNFANKFIINVRNLDKRKKIDIVKIRNLFDEQRFGKDNLNILLGKLLLQKNYKEFSSLLNINVENNDYVSSLRKYGVKRLRFYIHSYQSYLWNSMAVKSKKKELPLSGFLTKETKDLKDLLKKDGLELNSFIFRDIPELSSEGSLRQVYVKISNFNSKWEKDDMFPEKHKCILNFILQKGSYGTLVVKELFD